MRDCKANRSRRDDDMQYIILEEQGLWRRELNLISSEQNPVADFMMI
jgi:hypothetical protein